MDALALLDADVPVTLPPPVPRIAPHTKRRWIVSVDLGQQLDPSAVAVLEVVTRDAVRDAYWDAPEDVRPMLWEPPRAWYGETVDMFGRKSNGLGILHPDMPARISIRHLQRLPLRMEYPDQIAHIAKLLTLPPLDRVRPELILDQTGVGRPIVDMARRAGLNPTGVTITAGRQETRGDKADEWHVAKILLVSRLQAALHERILKIGKVADAQTLASEMQDFRGMFTESGNARFGAREGAHDDLVLAVALGVYWASRDLGTWSSSRYYI